MCASGEQMAKLGLDDILRLAPKHITQHQVARPTTENASSPAMPFQGAALLRISPPGRDTGDPRAKPSLTSAHTDFTQPDTSALSGSLNLAQLDALGRYRWRKR